MKTSERTLGDLEDLRVISEAETAALLGVHINTLKRMRGKGIGPKVTYLNNMRRLGYRPVDIRRYLDDRAQIREAEMNPETPPPAERAEVGLETIAAAEAIRHRDFDKLNTILMGSKHAAKLHAIEALVLCAYLIDRDPDPDALIAELRERVIAAGLGPA